ncbi:ATP-binding cassette domain-containing protein [Streptomyces thermocarboxydovorans]|uniref:ABC transporter ATP-binding protein C-terminal domain-containing protein n=1 Tax=Streptomyces thermocarboxydovorans TaxID=59298 RepID=UPI0031E4882B
MVERGRPADEPERLLRSAAAALMLGNVTEARRAGARALAAVRTLGAGALAPRALEYLAYAELRSGRHQLARTHAEEGLRSARRAGFAASALRLPGAVREQRAHLARAREIAELTGLAEHFDSPVHLLPCGDRKRVELARALCLEPRVLLLDEPVAGMNAAERARTADVIGTLRAELGLTVLLVEHDMGLVMRLADEVTVLDFGRTIAHGTPDEVRRDPRVLRACLGTGTEEEDAA